MKPPKEPSKRATVAQQVEGLEVYLKGGEEALGELMLKNKAAYDKAKAEYNEAKAAYDEAEHEKANPSKTE